VKHVKPADLLDQEFGPRQFRVCVENVADFVRATGDDVERWDLAAPPGFMAVTVFVVAADLLGQLSDHSVIHGEQVFSWHRRLGMESELEVVGRVSRVRERGGTDFVGFDVEVVDDTGPVADAASLFLVSPRSSSGAEVKERVEPAPEDDGSPGPGQVAVSRAGLVRYAAATRDWNPIHWDHEAAVAAGLPGIVAHGLLQSAWALSAASKLRPGDAPLRSAKVRFRNPLPPATPVTVTVEESGHSAIVAVEGGGAEYVNARVQLSEQ
jgi:acyl dehydratase